MGDRRIAPYGSWRSPISADLIASSAIGLGQIALDGDEVYWTEIRPTDGGRSVLVRCDPHGIIADVTRAPFNVRTRVHEYGGGAFCVAGGIICFSHFGDHRLYRVGSNGDPNPITPQGQFCYADGVIDRGRSRMVCVRENHSAAAAEPVNTLISVPLDGAGTPSVLVSGNDFYSTPRLSPDGTRLAWLTWNHPNMPWDGTELWVASFNEQGGVALAQLVAGSIEESIFQPEWSSDGVLHFISDRTGWWNLYRWRHGAVDALCPREAEFGLPQWAFGMSTYGFASADKLICSFSDGGVRQVAELDTRTLTRLPMPYHDVSSVQVAHDRLVFAGGSPTAAPAVVLVDLVTKASHVLRRSSTVEMPSDTLSVARPIEFATEGGLTAHAFFYRPRNSDWIAPAGDRPPLLVISHGGPTAAASDTLRMMIQYWTSRGIAVVDVNYGGSTGYGRAYRRRLDGQWGLVDVDDCVNAARFLVDHGEVDGDRLAIRGSSAGGYTTLCALTFRNVFKAGASYYGIGDLEALAKETHKFESRYEDRLVGPYPARADLYRERSPIHFTERLSCPVIFFQGLDDKVVPPSQAEAMVAALRERRVPVAYVPFVGEQHGFRKAENIARALEAELSFYGRVFGFALGDPVAPVEIENL